nr:ribonuclease H-like domain, reverse transcriptase, RNA-dependent DNA polymerase [Tanacetum cinerariifolium]
MFKSQISGVLQNSPSHFDRTPLRGFRTLNDLYENIEKLLLAEDEPKNYKEASSDQKWIEAMKAELDSINRNNTWKLTTLPKGHKAIGLKWVFKTKRDANGNIIKHKARLVAKGYIQEHGIDFEKLFAPVARMETIRLLLAIAANNKWEVHHLDVKSAFLHGDLKEEVYVTQPENFVKKQDQGKVYKLIKAKALYGLRQAPPLSSCESEFIVATAAATQALWLKRLLSKLTHSEEDKVTIKVDNKSVIALMKNPVFHGRSKHIDTKYHFIRECVEREDIQVEFVSGEYQRAENTYKSTPEDQIPNHETTHQTGKSTCFFNLSYGSGVDVKPLDTLGTEQRADEIRTIYHMSQAQQHIAMQNEDLLKQVNELQDGFQNQANRRIAERGNEGRLKSFRVRDLERQDSRTSLFQEEENDAGHVQAPTPLA